MRGSTKSSLGHLPLSTQWAFDESVTEVFTDMLERSVPQYEVFRSAVFELGKEFVQAGTHIVDLGCSRGDALAPFVDTCGSENRYIGVEVSQPMLDASRRRFEKQIDAGLVELLNMDLRRNYPKVESSLTLSVLTLQFIPLNYRQRVVAEIYQSLVPGGALIMVEKLFGATPKLDELMIKHYYRFKNRNGYTDEEIERKRLSLEGVLVPLTAQWNEEMLKTAGFAEVDCFWRWMNFAGWVAIKR